MKKEDKNMQKNREENLIPSRSQKRVRKIEEDREKNKTYNLLTFVLILYVFTIILFVLSVVFGPGKYNEENIKHIINKSNSMAHEAVVKEEEIKEYTFSKMKTNKEKLVDPLNMVSVFEVTPAAFGEDFNKQAIKLGFPLLEGFTRDYSHYVFKFKDKTSHVKEENEETIENDRIIREPEYHMRFKEYDTKTKEPPYLVFSISEVDLLQDDSEFFIIGQTMLDILTNKKYTKEIKKDLFEMKTSTDIDNKIYSKKLTYNGIVAEFYKNEELWFVNISNPIYKKK